MSDSNVNTPNSNINGDNNSNNTTISDYAQKIRNIAQIYENRDRSPFNPDEPFYSVVPMFPYPSGKIHMGHVRNYAITNAVTQYKKSQGIAVFHPIGFDSFGLPAENAAIKNHVSPKVWTERNIEQMSADFKHAGFDFNWDNAIYTHQYDYYRFEQDIFKKAWARGLIYKKEQYVNYDPVDKTVLSNEQVQNGLGWRTGAKVIRKKIPMYFFDMKRYAHRLFHDLDTLKAWPKKVIEMQKSWINLQEGMAMTYSFDNANTENSISSIAIFKADKISPEKIQNVIVGINHPWVQNWENHPDFMAWSKEQSQGSVSQKENFGKKVHFATGCAVSFYDNETHTHIDNIPVIIDMNLDDECRFDTITSPAIEPTHKMGIGTEVSRERHTFIGLKDWCISRQRYWGNPIPVVHCEDCGDVISDNVMLPDNLIPDGSGNILDKTPEYYQCECPQCQKPATRCTDTMDTFVQSSWYFHRYINPQSDMMIPKPDNQIDHYVGGVEHATMHLIYTRFFHKMLADFGMVTTGEPIKKLTTQGMVCKKYMKEDGTMASAKMSKSIGNIVEPNAYIDRYGSDAVQMFMIFAAPPDQNFDFEDAGIVGSYRFIEEVYRYFFEENKAPKTIDEQASLQVMQKMQQYVAKEFDGRFNLNTIVPQIMIAFKAMKRTQFQTPEIKEEVEKMFVNNFRIFAPQLGYYIHQYCFKPKNETKIGVKM
jgi:leucyl-tRNA synthetase